MAQDRMEKVQLVTEPTVTILADLTLEKDGIIEMAKWVKNHRPNCGIDLEELEGKACPEYGLLPHDMWDNDKRMLSSMLTDNEVLCELAGRKCYSGDTEILTYDDGWVSFSEFLTGVNKPDSLSKVATYDPNNRRITFEQPTGIVRKRHRGKMYTAKSRAFDIRVTADHEMLANRNGIWSFVEAQELLGKKYGIARSGQYDGDGTGFEPDAKAEAWAEVIGFYLSEGTHVDGKKYGTDSRVYLYQKEGPVANRIRGALTELGLEFGEYTDNRNNCIKFGVNDTAFADHMAKLYGQGSLEKRVPAHVFHWDADLRALLLDAMFAGDGTKSNGYRVYSTISKDLADAVQTLLILSGKPGSISVTPVNDGKYPTSFSGNHNVYRVREGRDTVAHLNGHTQHDCLEDVDEDVYCLTVPNRTLVVRRNNKVYIASNCYDSFGDAAGRPTNKEYLQHIMEVKHNSVLYHAKMVFFFGGISRRLSHELIRTYVGADRENDGSPSQESTRFTYHYGFYIAPPRTLENEECTEVFRELCQENYDSYCNYVDNQIEIWEDQHEGQRIPTMERKRIFEDAAGRLLMQAETSLIWTTNPVAITKQILERTSPYADREYQRFARMLAKVCVDRWPNLFPEPIHKIAQEEQ